MRTMNQIKKSDMISKFAEVVGSSKAQSLIAEALQVTNVGDKTDYNQDETLKMCEILKTKGGVIKIIADLLSSEAHLLGM